MRLPTFKGRTWAIIVVLAVAGVLILADQFTSTTSTSTGTGGGSAVVVPQSGAGTADATSSPTNDLAGVPASGTPSSPATPAGDGDDGVGSLPPATATADPAAREAATAFTAAWLNTYKRSDAQWRDGILPRVTEDLAADLENADPATVPAGGRVGTVKASLDGQLTVADVQVVTDGGPKATLGTLHLSLVQHGSTWLISEIDWVGKQ